MKTYLCFERFITENKPLVVKKEFSIRDLRDEIKRELKVSDLPDEIKIIFSSDPLSSLLFFKILISHIYFYISKHLGNRYFEDLFYKISEKNGTTQLFGLKDGVLVLYPEIDKKTISSDETIFLLKNFLADIFYNTERSMGKDIILKEIDAVFEKLSSFYEKDKLRLFLDIIPDGFLVTQKASLLAREELEKRYEEAIRSEKQKNKELEELTFNLKDTVSNLEKSKAAISNLLQDLELEKESVDKEVSKRTEELSMEKAILISTVESLPMSFLLLKRDGEIILSNENLRKLLKINADTKYLNIEEGKEFALDLDMLSREVFDSGNTKTISEIFWKERYYKLFLSPVLSEKTKKIIAVFFLIEDITEDKIIERSKEEFFSIASHELRTPLTAIRGNASMILEFFASTMPSKDVEQMVTDIHDSSIRLIKIVNDFLTASRLEQGKLLFKKENFKIKDLVEELFREYNTLAISRGLYLKKNSVECDNCAVFSDKDKTKQIISNILSNAINYTKKGGVNIWFEKDERQKSIIVYVKDTGEGIAETQKSFLFKKFQQAQESILTRDVTQSTGLGLYISKLLADGMGCEVKLEESEIDKGSVFSLKIPIAYN